VRKGGEGKGEPEQKKANTNLTGNQKEEQGGKGIVYFSFAAKVRGMLAREMLLAAIRGMGHGAFFCPLEKGSINSQKPGKVESL